MKWLRRSYLLNMCPQQTLPTLLNAMNVFKKIVFSAKTVKLCFFARTIKLCFPAKIVKLCFVTETTKLNFTAKTAKLNFPPKLLNCVFLLKQQN